MLKQSLKEAITIESRGYVNAKRIDCVQETEDE